MKKQLLFLLCLLSITISQSQTFNDGVLEYTVTDATNNYVSVKKYNDTCPTGDLVIPETIMDSGTTYAITSIAENAFHSCSDITSVSFPDGLSSIGGYAFVKCNGLTDLSLPEGLISIGTFAFDECKFIESASFPDGLTSIEKAAFKNCIALKSISLPESLSFIDVHGFARCYALTSVTVHWNTPLFITDNVFFNMEKGSISLTVPPGTIPAYQAAPVWQDFGSFAELGISDLAMSSTVRLYPNPASGFLNIELDDASELKKTTIYNSLGQLISEENKSQINVSNYSKGLYFAQIETAKGKVSKKFMVK